MVISTWRPSEWLSDVLCCKKGLVLTESSLRRAGALPFVVLPCMTRRSGRLPKVLSGDETESRRLKVSRYRQWPGPARQVRPGLRQINPGCGPLRGPWRHPKPAAREQAERTPRQSNERAA